MTIDPALIARIKDYALNLPIACEDTVFLDKLLGAVEMAVHDARSAIDDEWREARAARSTSTTLRPMAAATPTLEDLS